MSTGTPAASPASTSRVAPSIVSPIGFSTITGTPAATHSSPPSTCIWFGVARMTPSGLSRSNNSASDRYSGTRNFSASSGPAGPGSTIEASSACRLASTSSM